MIKTTIAVMASLMLVACGKSDQPEGGTPAGQNVENADASKVDASKVDASKVETSKADASKAPDVIAKAPEVAANDLTLTYFSLDG
tara:strand:- start:4393 stop:4650 length:258 start_codon:yes stop_codon:yes gene_type:complete